MPTIGILPIEYMGIKEILGITYKEKMPITYNQNKWSSTIFFQKLGC